MCEHSQRSLSFVDAINHISHVVAKRCTIRRDKKRREEKDSTHNQFETNVKVPIDHIVWVSQRQVIVNAVKNIR